MRTLDATFTVYLPPRPERVLAFLKERLHCRLLSAERVAFDLVWHDSETRGEHYRHDAPVYRFAHQGLEFELIQVNTNLYVAPSARDEGGLGAFRLLQRFSRRTLFSETKFTPRPAPEGWTFEEFFDALQDAISSEHWMLPKPATRFYKEARLEGETLQDVEARLSLDDQGRPRKLTLSGAMPSADLPGCATDPFQGAPAPLSPQQVEQVLLVRALQQAAKWTGLELAPFSVA